MFKVVNKPCESHEDIDDVLREYLAFTSRFKGMSRWWWGCEASERALLIRW